MSTSTGLVAGSRILEIWRVIEWITEPNLLIQGPPHCGLCRGRVPSLAAKIKVEVETDGC